MTRISVETIAYDPGEAFKEAVAEYERRPRGYRHNHYKVTLFDVSMGWRPDGRPYFEWSFEIYRV